MDIISQFTKSTIECQKDVLNKLIAIYKNNVSIRIPHIVTHDPEEKDKIMCSNYDITNIKDFIDIECDAIDCIYGKKEIEITNRLFPKEASDLYKLLLGTSWKLNVPVQHKLFNGIVDLVINDCVCEFKNVISITNKMITQIVLYMIGLNKQKGYIVNYKNGMVLKIKLREENINKILHSISPEVDKDAETIVKQIKDIIISYK